MRKIVSIVFICSVMLLAGCSKKEVKQESVTTYNNNTLSAAGTGDKDKNFKIQYASPRMVYKIEEADLDNNGKDEYIVFSI
ncbi:MAG: hypothetical protein KBG21_04850, partial [Ignavibacteria bacterium]|nr:hypothetical protein [Ignavibacteria bacterium]